MAHRSAPPNASARLTSATANGDDQPQIEKLCRLIESAHTPPSLQDLATAVSWSPFHLQRRFKAATGLSPHQYAAALRGRQLRQQLHNQTSVTTALMESGFQSISRGYAQSQQHLGMKPRNYQRGGAGSQVHFAIAQCALGALLVAATTEGLCAISLGDDAETLLLDFQAAFPNAMLKGSDPHFDLQLAQVVAMIETPGIALDLPLDIRGSAFQIRVWEALRRIPAGSTATYADIAAAIGAPRAVRAVASACAANRIAVAIPCHRVIRSDGSLSGYRWGVDRKRALLLKEQAQKQ